jgi:hypothetical protein
MRCYYDVCGDGAASLWVCQNAGFTAGRECGPLQCPETRPTFLAPCWPLEGLECGYEEDCCGAAQVVSALCQEGAWMLYGDRDACDVCGSAVDGEDCHLPDGCEKAACFSISCYGQPLVKECVEGKWSVQTTCSK